MFQLLTRGPERPRLARASLVAGNSCRRGSPTIAHMPELDLSADAVTLTEALVNIESVSRDEKAIAAAIEMALTGLDHLHVTRHGNTLVARTALGRADRVGNEGPIDRKRRA